MATFETLKNGRIRASVFVQGIRESKTWPTTKRAKSWAREREIELSKRGAVLDDSQTFKDLFERYACEVSPSKEGAHWERVRLNMFVTRYERLSSIRLVKATTEDIEDWIALRAKSVKPSTINRELNLISHTLKKAEKWRWIAHNPMKGVERPKNPPARFRRIPDHEIQTMCHVLGYSEKAPLTLKRELVAVAFLFAIETAMRAGEICSLTPSNIDLKNQVALLTKTKNGDERKVPLSNRAIELLERLPPPESDEHPIFQLTSGVLSSTFRKHRLLTGIQDLTFHDTRHEATTRLADKLHVLELAAVTGHRNINELLTYYNKSAADIAVKLNAEKEEQEPPQTDYSQMAKHLLQEITKMGGLQAVS